MSLYDSLYLYALAVRDAYDIAKDEDVYKDGALIWNKMTGKQFIGIAQKFFRKPIVWK